MKRILSSIFLALATVTMFGAPVFAEGDVAPQPEQKAIEPTFSEEINEQANYVKLRFGKNQLFAGNNLDINAKSSGLLFAFGNQLQLGAESEYSFVAGNLINYSATTEKDLFIAGNIIDLESDAKIGRDVYAAGYRVILSSNLRGDFSAGADQVVLRDVEVAGNVNLDAANIFFEGNISIAGTLSYNDDAQVHGLDNVKAAKVETYVAPSYTLTAAELWLSKLMSIISFVLAAVVVLAFSARLRKQVAGEKAVQAFGANLVAGFVVLLLVPIVSILLLMSYFAAPLGIMMILMYVIMIYLAQALAGAWLGHVIVAKLLRSQAHIFIETIIGIIVLVCCSMIPGLNVITTFLAILLGLGIIVRSVKPGKNNEVEAAPVDSPIEKRPKVAKASKSTKAKNSAPKSKSSKPKKDQK